MAAALSGRSDGKLQAQPHYLVGSDSTGVRREELLVCYSVQYLVCWVWSPCLSIVRLVL